MTTYEQLGKMKCASSAIYDVTSSFTEAATWAISSINEEENSLFKSIGIHELAVYESTGVEMIYEGAEGESLKEKFVKIVEDLWAKIKEFFKNVAETAKKLVNNFKKSVAGAVDKRVQKRKITKEMIEAVKADLVFKGSINTYAGIEDMKKTLKAGSENIKSIIRKKLDIPYSDKDASLKAVYKTIIPGCGCEDLSSVKKYIEAECKGEDKNFNLLAGKDDTATGMHADKLLDQIENINKVLDSGLSDITSSYAEQKETCALLIESIRSTKGNLKKDAKEKGAEDDFDKIGIWFKASLLGAKTIYAANAKLIDIEFKRWREYSTFMVRLHHAYAKAVNAEKKTVKTESYFLDRVSEAFDW